VPPPPTLDSGKGNHPFRFVLVDKADAVVRSRSVSPAHRSTSGATRHFRPPVAEQLGVVVEEMIPLSVRWTSDTARASPHETDEVTGVCFPHDRWPSRRIVGLLEPVPRFQCSVLHTGNAVLSVGTQYTGSHQDTRITGPHLPDRSGCCFRSSATWPAVPDQYTRFVRWFRFLSTSVKSTE